MRCCQKQKIGPAPNIALAYPNSNRPEDIIAEQNANAIRNWLYLDMAVYGRYNNLVWAYLEAKDATPTFAPGDAEVLKAAKPDFIAFNYYTSFTVEASDGSEQIADKFADQQSAMSEPGYYRSVQKSKI